MANPKSIRSTAGFRSLQIVQLNTSGSIIGVPMGSVTLEPFTPFAASGSVISSSGSVVTATGTAVTGSVAYYGILVTGTKVLTINDPNPRSIAHTGEDALLSVQVLPALEPITGELRLDKTSDILDSITGAVNTTTVGEANLIGVGTDRRGFEAQVGALAYSAAQDTDPAINSTTFGSVLWDFRIFPKVNVFVRDPGYGQEANERLYTFQPIPSSAHLWGVQFTTGTEGYRRAQMIRGVSQYKPVICGFLGDAATKAFPFDTARPAATTAKIAVWVDGVLQSSGYTASLYGIVFTAAPAALKNITVFYEVA